MYDSEMEQEWLEGGNYKDAQGNSGIIEMLSWLWT
jgi:hypothetical protein